MTRQRWLLLLVSVALTFASFLLLTKIASVDIRTWAGQLRGIKLPAFALLVFLTAIHIGLANWKWRCVDDRVRHPSDSQLSWRTSFALTSLGTALGQVLPIQACMTVARSLGTYLYGSPLRRGTVATIFEQGFDVLIVVFLAVASLVTWLAKGGWLLWTTSAIVMVVVAVLAVGACMRVLHRASEFYLRRFAKKKTADADALNTAGLALLNVRLGRRLILLSAARSLIQILMAAVAASALDIHIATWQLAAALPFVIFATVLAITPGGLGVTELTYAGALHLFGIPLELGGRWALANRILVLSSCFIVAAIAGVYALAMKLKSASSKPVIKDLPLSSRL